MLQTQSRLVLRISITRIYVSMNIFRQEAEALSKECNMKLYRTSVKDDLNVGVVFQHLAENYVNKVRMLSNLLLGGGIFTRIEYLHPERRNN